MDALDLMCVLCERPGPIMLMPAFQIGHPGMSVPRARCCADHMVDLAAAMLRTFGPPIYADVPCTVEPSHRALQAAQTMLTDVRRLFHERGP